jgi:hypothetical protein
MNRQKSLDVGYNLNNIMKLLVFSRLINPCSKKKTFESKDLFFEHSDFSLLDIYRALSHINKFKDALQVFIYINIKNHHLHSVAIRAMLIPYSAWYGGEHEPQPKK